MYCVKKITEDLTWVGSNDRRLALFEGVYSVPRGVSYNSYVLMDEKTVLMDTVDKAVTGVFFENIAHVLNGRKLDYMVIQHMEPDHSSAIEEVLLRYPEVTIVCNQKTAGMMARFVAVDLSGRTQIVKEGETLPLGRHVLTFVNAPMVHWPEVMVTYDITDKILFSADAFGTFGAINGAMFADEVDFERDYLDEARRYYTNIVGKYGSQVQAILKKAATLDIAMVCPLHGFVWRKNIGDFIAKYQLWSTYTPEVTGVMIAYASIYGGTENAAEILACRLRDLGIRTTMFDVSVTPASEIIAAAFQYSHLVFASPTYNAGIYVAMEALLHDLVAHNLQNRTVALIENGSWAPTSGKLMKELLSKLKNITFVGETLTIPSTVKDASGLELLAEALAATIRLPEPAASAAGTLDASAMFKLSYGLFVLSGKDGEKDNGCITNTVMQLTDAPKRLAFAVNKANLTCEMIAKNGDFAVSVLSQEAPFTIFQHFGFQSGRDADKYAGWAYADTAANGVKYLTKYTNAVIAGKVVAAVDWGTHTLFIADVTEARILSQEPSMTYQYYFDHVKPKPQAAPKEQKGWVCKICGYVYEGEALPADYICPLCKHGAEDFERLG
ncbi:MAG: MBL fold metallo-hydrolase [Oscillospiraceae bacterium]|nr:MBL fold metallo-hydrolase [Oscillospiraceae bacterium]